MFDMNREEISILLGLRQIEIANVMSQSDIPYDPITGTALLSMGIKLMELTGIKHFELETLLIRMASEQHELANPVNKKENKDG